MSDQEQRAFLASGNLLTLSQAANLTTYSSEYLSLRARSGHLKAVKIGSFWLTTKEAVLAYVHCQQQKHQKMMQTLHEAERSLS